MNIFSKITLQSLKKNRTRTIVTIFGVIISVSMIAGVTAFISSLQNYLLKDVAQRKGDWHISYYDASSDFMKELQDDSNIKNITEVRNVGYAFLEYGQNNYKPFLFISGFTEEALNTLPIHLISGRMPENSGEILIPAHVEDNGGVKHKIGDELKLDIGTRMLDNRKLWQNNSYEKYDPEDIEYEDDFEEETFTPMITKTYTIVGFFQRPEYENQFSPGYTCITLAETYTNPSGSIDLYVQVKNLRSAYDYAENIDRAINEALNRGENIPSNIGNEENFAHVEINREYLRFSGVFGSDGFNLMLLSLSSVLIVLIMIGSVLFIYNSFSISVSERTRQFGMLSSIGATKKQLRKSVLFEGVCIGIIGIPLGILAGIGGMGIALIFVNDVLQNMTTRNTTLDLFVSVPAVVCAVVVGIITILISAYIPAKRASKQSAVDTIRGAGDIKRKEVKTSKLFMKLAGVEGMLARKNFKRNKKRYRTTIISLFVSVVLFISSGAFGMYLGQGSEKTVYNVGFDIIVNSYGTFKNNIPLYDKLQNVEGVYKSGYMSMLNFDAEKIPKERLSQRYREIYGLDYYNDVDIFDDDGMFHLQFMFIAIDEKSYIEYIEKLELPVDEYIAKDGKLLLFQKVQQFDPDSERIVSFDMFEEKGDLEFNITPSEDRHGIGNNIKTKTITATTVEEMPAIFSETHHTIPIIYVPYSWVDQDNSDFINFSMMFLSNDPAKTADEMHALIETMDEHKNEYNLTNMAQIQENNRNLLFITNVFTYGFIILMSLITIANVFNTITTNINLRRREFAMLKSMGMTNRGFNKIMIYECLFYGIKALIFGLPVSFGVTYLIYKGVMQGVDIAFSLPWASIAIAIFSVFFIVFITMIYSINKVKKENTIEALKFE